MNCRIDNSTPALFHSAYGKLSDTQGIPHGEHSFPSCYCSVSVRGAELLARKKDVIQRRRPFAP